MRKALLFLLIILLISGVTSESYAVSEAAVLFLMISPGARAAGMGEAFVATANDATAVYWNPAGLAFQYGKEITLMHANWLPALASDMYYEFFAYRQDIEGVGTIGTNITFLNMGEQIRTGENSPEEIGRFVSYDVAFSCSYGTTITENFALGVTYRYIRSNLSDIGAGNERGSGKANAFAFDIGLLYKMPYWGQRLTLGMNLSNLGPKIAYIDASQADPIPTNLKAGFAFKIVNQKYNKLTVVGDVNKLMVTPHKDGEKSDPFYKAIVTSWYDDSVSEEFSKMIYSAGIEYFYSDLIAFRAGYYYDETGKVKFPSFGAGLKYSLYGFDFAYVAAEEGHPLSDTMRFSLTIGF